MNKCVSTKEIDELGKGIVISYLKKLGIRQLPDCVDIEGIANSLGLKVRYESIAEADFRKIGFLADGKTPLQVRHDGKTVPFLFPLGTIVLDAGLRRDNESGKCRFTIAHEVAHHILDLHNPQPAFQREWDAEYNYSQCELKAMFNMMESQADKLAAALLMPDFIVKRAMAKEGAEGKIPVYGSGVVSNEGRIRLNRIANRIGVSYTALFIRLRQFDLLDYRPLCEYTDRILL